jgi:hypothetical protein
MSELYAIKRPDKSINIFTIHRIKSMAINTVCHIFYSDNDRKYWQRLKRKGYKCVRVEVKEVNTNE